MMLLEAMADESEHPLDPEERFQLVDVDELCQLQDSGAVACSSGVRPRQQQGELLLGWSPVPTDDHERLRFSGCGDALHRCCMRMCPI